MLPALRERLRELRGGNHDANIEPALVRVLDEIVHASNTEEFVAGAYLELEENLLRSYRAYLGRLTVSQCPREPDFRRLVPELELHISGGRLA